MSSVYRAYDPLFAREVAIKVLPAQFTHDPTFRARFEREARIIANLEHPAIVPVYDFGEEDNQPYLVMRLMSGGSLADRLAKRPLTLQQAAEIFEIIAPALDEAHRQNIIHRDLKPGNILFDRSHLPHLADFGIVKITQQDGSASLTGTGGLVGTPAYMSPEQVLAKEKLDGRSDVYSLGVILYEMLSGRQPYEADTPFGLAMQQITEPVPLILVARPELPTPCQTMIDQAMAKNRNERYATAAELTDAVVAMAAAGNNGHGHVVAPIQADPVPGVTSAPLVEDAKLDELYHQAMLARDSGDWDLTIVKLNAILGFDSNYGDTVAQLTLANRQKHIATLLSQAGTALAQEKWTEATELASQVISVDEGDWAEAAVLLNRIISVDATHREAPSLLEKVLIRQEEPLYVAPADWLGATSGDDAEHPGVSDDAASTDVAAAKIFLSDNRRRRAAILAIILLVLLTGIVRLRIGQDDNGAALAADLHPVYGLVAPDKLNAKYISRGSNMQMLPNTLGLSLNSQGVLPTTPEGEAEGNKPIVSKSTSTPAPTATSTRRVVVISPSQPAAAPSVTPVSTPSPTPQPSASPASPTATSLASTLVPDPTDTPGSPDGSVDPTGTTSPTTTADSTGSPVPTVTIVTPTDTPKPTATTRPPTSTPKPSPTPTTVDTPRPSPTPTSNVVTPAATPTTNSGGESTMITPTGTS
jgi:hypothetical protein